MNEDGNERTFNLRAMNAISQTAWRKPARAGLLLAEMIVLLAAFSQSSPLCGAELISESLRIGFTQACFVGVNRNDAEASFKVFLRTVGRKRGYDIQAEVKVFDDNTAFEKAIENDAVQLAILDSWSYVGFDTQKVLEPAFVPLPNNTIGRTYVILTQEGNGLASLADLKGKQMMRLEAGTATMGRRWLDTLLLSNGWGTEEEYFGEMTATGKPTLAMLPVFFGKKQGCLVDLPAFELMKELNPQLGTKLRVVAASEPCVDNVICLARRGWSSETYRTRVKEALSELHVDSSGQQILTMFKVGKLVAYDKASLESVRKLRATYDQFSGARERQRSVGRGAQPAEESITVSEAQNQASTRALP